MTLSIEFPLPFLIPIKTDNTVVSAFPDFAVFKYRFLDILKNDADGNVIENKTTTIKLFYTPLMDTSTFSKDDHLYYGVLNSVIFLNNFIDAYRITNKIEYIKNFTITDLPPVIKIEHGDELIVYVTQPKYFSFDQNQLDKGMIDNAVQKINQWRSYKPFEVIDRFLSKAIHHLYTEDFLSAIIEMQTSFESFIRLCQHIILNAENTSPEDIDKSMSINFRNTIEHHLGPALKTDLGFEKNPVINDWYKNLYKVRNDVVHSGNCYIFGDEAYTAYDSFQNATNYLSSLMVKNGYMNEDRIIYVENLNKNLPAKPDSQFMEKLRKNGFLKFIEDSDPS